MNGKTSGVLFFLVLLLAGAIWFQRGAEQEQFLVERALFEGVDSSRVRTIRIDNIERAFNMRLERDERGLWFLTDPLSYPADYSVVQLLVEDIARARAMPVPENERGAKELGFDPPRVVIEVDEVGENGEIETFVVEIGATDLDGMRVNVRANGVYLRSLVRLYTTLNREVDDFRTRYPLTMGIEDIASVLRTGKVAYEAGGPSYDTQLLATRDGLSWYASVPRRALLDNLEIGTLVVGAVRLEIMHFVDDAVQDLRNYGLDTPEAGIEFQTVDGASETLLLGRVGNSRPWYLTREGSPYVWSIPDAAAMRLMIPFEGMLDGRFMRVLRSDVTAVDLALGERVIHLQRELQGWSVSQRQVGEGFTPALRADEQAVEDMLARLEDLEFTYSEQATESDFSADGSVFIETYNGRFGGSFALQPEVDELLYRREGDEVVFAGPAWFGALATRPLSEFRSSQLTRLTENSMRYLRLEYGGTQVEFERDRHGLWHQAGVSEEAHALLPLLDQLIYLRAESFPDAMQPVQDGVSVEFEPFEGDSTRFEIYSAADGGSLATVGGAQALLKKADLYKALRALVNP